jgi:LmbE family N-acetylglucosaminyl deacetylase
MMKITFDKGAPKSILCLGAHCDDIEIGCGGSILKFCREQKYLNVHWVVFSSDDRREKEALRSAGVFLKGIRRKQVEIHQFRNSFFPYQGVEIKEHFEKLKLEISPDLIFTHYRNDLHQDHRLISELTWNTFRDHLILEYEIPKYDGDMGSPNFFVDLCEEICATKIKNIINIFKSQKDKRWFTKDTFFSLLRIRGIESNAFGKYAEGFYCRKLIF